MSPLDESPFPKYIFGLHDPGGQHLMFDKNKQGWVLVTEELGADPGGPGGPDYRHLSNQDLGVIVRLNHGYGDKGTIPRSSRYDDFAQRCGNFVAGSQGCHIWIIGNEPNLAWERPGGPNGEVITPELYARCFKRCRNNIHSRPGRENDQVVVGAVGPWNAQTIYPENPSGNWIKYFTDILHLVEDQCDGIAIHTYTKGYNLDLITGDFYSWKNHSSPDLRNRRDHFRCYIDFMEAIPHSMRHLPVYITETDQDLEWRTDEHTGWVQAAYAEIDRWNRDPSHQPIQALLLYRWVIAGMGQEKYSIVNRHGVQADFKAAMDHDYRVRLPGVLTIYKVNWLDIDTPVSMMPGQTVTAKLRLSNDGNTTWVRTGDHKVRLGYRWHTPAGQELDLADIRTSLPHNVKPDWLVAFEEAQVQAPPTPGQYILRWDMIEEPDTWFWKQGSPREDIHVEVQGAGPDYKVAWLDYSVPETIPPDSVTTASFKLKNEGSKSWPAEGPNPVHLAYHWFTPSGQLAGCWDTFRAALPDDVPPGSEVDLANVVLKSPATSGQYVLRWDLVEEGVAWFSKEGATPLEMTIEVAEGGIPSTPWQAQASHNQADVGKAFDSDPDTFWDSEAGQQPGMWYELDLGQAQTIERIKIESPGRGFATAYVLSVSTDRSDWEVVREMPLNWMSIDASFTPRSVRYIKIEQTGTPSWGAHWLISEITIGLAHP
ncbi:MAG: discoidin domain-containing protein [Anaerolineae bacterium]